MEHWLGDCDRLGRALEFNFLPASYMDVSWWREEWMPQALFSELRQSPASLMPLSDFIVERLDLPPVLDVDYSAPGPQLALLAKEAFSRLVFSAGVVRMSPWIASILTAVDIGEIKRRIGSDLYEFALRSGRFLLRQARLLGPDPPAPDCEPGSLDEHCRMAGIQGLAAALQPQPAPLVRRVKLKLPKPLVDSHWPCAAESSAEWLRMFSLIERQLLAVPVSLPAGALDP
ncbi:MAG: SctK family type III secretion system sorting platform protein [Gammaproteobacteria bacterium]|nr:SctK family type III secretion system sorting platform protein [Gammaproteobacteria bacterium]MDE0273937.1 SctK family type III secretion system sorting platform protein [Gammaproteobacteria bacterium]